MQNSNYLLNGKQVSYLRLSVVPVLFTSAASSNDMKAGWRQMVQGKK